MSTSPLLVITNFFGMHVNAANAGMGNVRSLRQTMVLFAPLLFVVLTSSCSSETSKEKLENRRLTAALLDLKSDGRPLKRLTELPDIDPASTICVLEPYRDRVDQSKPFADVLNQQLNAIQYAADEGHWAIVQLGKTGSFQISRVNQTEIRLKESFPSDAQINRGFCGQASLIVIDTSIHQQIQFQLEGEK
jgi:hypothetical protein